MWDCTATSPRGEKGPVSIPMSPCAKRGKGESCWNHFITSCTPVELQAHSLKEYAGTRDFRVESGKLACKICDDGVLRTVLGHDQHYRVAHEGYDTIYDSFASEESSAGGRINPNVPKGRDPHRAKLLKELKALGVTAKQLAGEGYSIEELQMAHFTVKEILNTGKFSLPECCEAGVTRNLKEAGVSLKGLLDAGYSLATLKKAGFSCKTLKTTAEAKLSDLRSVGFTLHELREGGFTLTELKDLRRPSGQGTDPAFSLQDLKALGYTCKDMRRAGFTLAELKNGYTSADMKLVHATTKAELANDGFSLAELKLAGFHAAELKTAGFSVKDLTAVGFTKADIKGN